MVILKRSTGILLKNNNVNTRIRLAANNNRRYSPVVQSENLR